MRSRSTALITGASSGIGLELSRIHASRGGDLVLVARRRDRLETIADGLRRSHGVRVEVLPFDLTREEAPGEIVRAVRERGIEVEVLINNAGFGGHGAFHRRPWEADRAMIQVNVIAAAALTRLCLPTMLERRRGRILNVASVAGFVPGPLQAVYFASKAFLLHFTEAVAEEIRGSGVTVTALCPGSTRTEFFERAGLTDVRGLRFGAADPAKVARYGYDAMLRGKVVAVEGTFNKLLAHGLLRLLPRRWARRAVRWMMESPDPDGP